jgi:GTPase SAR1 family protein
MRRPKLPPDTPYIPGLEPAIGLARVVRTAAKPKSTSIAESAVSSPDEFSRGLASLSALITDFKTDDRNEATTRLHLIDRIIFECLGWTRDQCLAEEHHGGDYADYVFLHPWRTAILEAKREGLYFELPISRGGAFIRDLKPLLKSSPALNDAAQQVANYCQARGILIAILSNGRQFVAFIGSRSDGIPPLEGKALVFDSLERLRDNFVTAWNCLGPDGMATEGLIKLLLGQDHSIPPSKISSRINNYPGYIQRNDLQADLAIVADLVFHDISESKELEEQFLTECYCKSGALSQHSMLTRAILEARYAQLFNSDLPKPTVRSATNKKGKVEQELIAEGLAKRPIVLVGDVGAGKTTFLRKIITIDARDLLKDSIILYLDLGRSATLSSSIKEFVLTEIPRQLKEDYNFDAYERNTVRGIHHRKIEDFGKGINADLKEIDSQAFKVKEIEYIESLLAQTSEHVRHAISHLARGRKHTVTIILDNCDQRDEASQQEAFLISQELANAWECLVFVTLRPETFNRSRKKGALTGYHSKVFTIAPPRSEHMLDKRLLFAEKICRGEVQLTRISSTTQFTKLQSFLEIVRKSMKENRQLAESIENISAGNMRMALDLLQSFISSGHVNSTKILKIHASEGRYRIAIHEFLRAIIFSDHNFYDPAATPITNIFQQWTNDKRETFLCLHILASLASIGETQAADGFVEFHRLVDVIQQLGYTPHQISVASHFCLSRNLIEAAGRLIPEISQDNYPGLRITSLGKYHIVALTKMFTYLDGILCDVRSEDDGFAQRAASAATLRDRVKATGEYVQALDALWIANSGFPSAALRWADIRAGIEADLVKIAKYA